MNAEELARLERCKDCPQNNGMDLCKAAAYDNWPPPCERIETCPIGRKVKTEDSKNGTD